MKNRRGHQNKYSFLASFIVGPSPKVLSQQQWRQLKFE